MEFYEIEKRFEERYVLVHKKYLYWMIGMVALVLLAFGFTTRSQSVKGARKVLLSDTTQGHIDTIKEAAEMAKALYPQPPHAFRQITLNEKWKPGTSAFAQRQATPPHYRIGQDGMVRLEGRAEPANGNRSPQIGTLPSEARPAENLLMPMVINLANQPAVCTPVKITTAGTLTLADTTNIVLDEITVVSLEGIAFRARVENPADSDSSD